MTGQRRGRLGRRKPRCVGGNHEGSGSGWLQRQRSGSGEVSDRVTLGSGGVDAEWWSRILSKKQKGPVPGMGRLRDSAVRGCLRPERQETRNLLGWSSLWTELCPVPTAAGWPALHRHLRNDLRRPQDWQTRPRHPLRRPRRILPVGSRCGSRRGGRGGCSPMPAPASFPSGLVIWFACVSRGVAIAGLWWPCARSGPSCPNAARFCRLKLCFNPRR